MAGRGGLLALGLVLAATVAGVLLWSTGTSSEAPELGAPDGAVSTGRPASRAGLGGGSPVSRESPHAASGGDTDRRRAAGATPLEPSPTELRRGRVVDARTSLGVSNAEVAWRRGERTSRATSDADGRFELNLAAGADAVLEVRHPQFVDAARPLGALPEADLVLALRRSAKLEVRVDGVWDPATPPEVQVGRPGAPEEETVFVTVAGRLGVFEDLAPGDVHVGVVPAQGAIVRREFVPLVSGETTRIAVSLEPGATVEGTVQLQGSLAPVVDACVQLSSEELDPLGGSSRTVETRTGVDGGFRFESLPAELSGTLTIDAPWGARLTLPVSGRPVRVRFPAPARLSGVVVDASGAPVSASVALWRAGRERALRRVASDTGGRFDLGEIPGGEKFELSASLEAAWGRVTFRVPHGGLRSDIELVLAEDLDLAGRVLRATDDAPLGGAQVRVTSGPRAGAEATTAADGSFVLALPEGKASVEVSAPGYRSRTLTVRAAETAEERVLKLEPGLPLTGWVVDGDGWGVSGAQVRARKGKDRREAVADGRGAFELDALTPGRWVVSAWTQAQDGVQGAPVNLEVVEGVPLEPLRIEVRFPAQAETCVIAGEIVIAGSGEPVPGLTFPKGGRVALDGARFVLHGQPPSDKYRLWARGAGVEEIFLSNLVLTPGARIEVGRLETRPTSRVRIRLTGAPIRRDEARVVLRRAEAPAFPWLRVPREIELDWNAGAWEADGVGRYAWTLLVREDGDLRHRERVEVRSRRQDFELRLAAPGSKRER